MWVEEFGGIDEVVFYVFCAVAAVILILSVANLFVGCCVSGYSGASSIDFNICFGAILLTYTVLVRGLKNSWTERDDLNIICQFYPAALLVGLTMFIGGLMVKAWGIWLYSKYNSDKKPISEEWKPNLWIWFLIIIIAAVSCVWCLVYTPRIKNVPQPGESNNTNISPRYECENEDGHDFEWKVATSVWHGFLLLLAVIAIIPNCAAVKNAEGKILSVVTLNTLFAVVAGVCIHFLYDEGSITVRYAIKGGLMLWMCLFADIMFLASKIVGNKRSKGTLFQRGDNYDTINHLNTDKGNRNNEYLEPTGGDTFQY